MKTVELSPTAAALEKARKLASKSDDWMTPSGEFSAEARDDYGLFEIEEQEGWEQTCHFDVLYRQKLTEIGYADAYAQGFDEADHQEPALYFHELFLLPLKEVFWERWAEIHHLYEFWEKNKTTPA